jgi:hypothetical protein
MLWQFTPLGAGVQNPVNCLNETSTRFLLPCIGTRLTLQECVKFLPLNVVDLIGRHPSIVAILTELNKRQRALVSFLTRVSDWCCFSDRSGEQYPIASCLSMKKLHKRASGGYLS